MWHLISYSIITSVLKIPPKIIRRVLYVRSWNFLDNYLNVFVILCLSCILKYIFDIDLYPLPMHWRGKDASQWDLDLSRQKFYRKMNSSAVIFETQKMRKIADFANFEHLWSLNANFAGHPVCDKMLGI